MDRVQFAIMGYLSLSGGNWRQSEENDGLASRLRLAYDGQDDDDVEHSR